MLAKLIYFIFALLQNITIYKSLITFIHISVMSFTQNIHLPAVFFLVFFDKYRKFFYYSKLLYKKLDKFYKISIFMSDLHLRKLYQSSLGNFVNLISKQKRKILRLYMFLQTFYAPRMNRIVCVHDGQENSEYKIHWNLRKMLQKSESLMAPSLHLRIIFTYSTKMALKFEHLYISK